MHTAQHKKSGFTLIEVLVAAAIISVLTGMGFAAYARFEARKRVSEAAIYFANQLRGVQKRADAGDVRSCVKDDTLLAFDVNVPISDTPPYISAAQITAVCQKPDTTVSNIGVGSINLSSLYNGVVFETSSEFRVSFRVLGRGVSVADSVLIKHPDVNQMYEVTVTTGGGVTVMEL